MAVIIIMLVLGVAVIIGGVIFVVSQSRAEKEKKLCYEAANRMIQEEYLNYSIRNNLNHPMNPPARKKTMLYIKEKKNKKNAYVFDPANMIRIGRSRQENDICIQDTMVSGKHCRIYQEQNQIVLQDFGGANGTMIKRQGSKNWLKGNAAYLQNHDKILIGNTWMVISIFYYDQAYM